MTMSDTQRQQILQALTSRSFNKVAEEDRESIRTGRGDQGRTSLLFDREVPKYHPRIRLLGQLDAANAQLSSARSQLPIAITHAIRRIQDSLVYVMGEVATHEDDLAKFSDFFHSLGEADLTQIEEAIREAEGSGTPFSRWLEDFSPPFGSLEIARTLFRLAESQAWEMVDQTRLRALIPQWLNRVADLLWTLARQASSPEKGQRTSKPTKNE